MNRLAYLYLLGILGSLLPLSAFGLTPTQIRLKTEHDRVLNEMNEKDAGGKPSDFDDPRIPPLLKRGWNLAGEWASEYIEHHKALKATNLVHIFDSFAPEPHGVKSKYGDFLEYTDYYFEGSAIRISSSTYVVRASYGYWFRSGTFMVIARNRDGHFEARWNIEDLAEMHYPLADELGRWGYLVGHAYNDGPLFVDRLIPLAVSRNGGGRFLVNAHQGADGGTQLDQLSVWEWDGAEAEPLLVEVYEYAADYGGLSYDGTTVRIKTKEPLETLFSCGMCADPRGIWKVKITPDGVQNRGHRYLQPEIKWADAFLSKLDKGDETDDLASDRVRAAIESAVKGIKDENAKYGIAPDQFSWGMLGECRVISRGQHGNFVISVDEGRLTFRYVMRGGKPYFTDFRLN